MATFFICPDTDEPGWREDAAAFAAALLEWSPPTVIEQAEPWSTIALRFELPEGTLGRLHRDGRAVPPEVPLAFYDASFDACVPLEPGTDGRTVFEAYLAAP